MIPIHQLLNRIRWDPQFAKGNFELGYYVRAENHEARTDFSMWLGLVLLLITGAGWCSLDSFFAAPTRSGKAT